MTVHGVIRKKIRDSYSATAFIYLLPEQGRFIDTRRNIQGGVARNVYAFYNINGRRICGIYNTVELL